MKNEIINRLEKLFSTQESIIQFIRHFLGCGCPEEVLQKAKVYFDYKPLLTYFLQPKIDEKIIPVINRYLGLPEDVVWPRNKKGKLRHPKSWTKKFLKKYYIQDYIPPFVWLRKLVFVNFEAMIDVPNRAYFCIKAGQAPFSSSQIEKAYACGELLKEITGYNNFRLITITTPAMVAPKEKIFKALNWQEVAV